MSSRSGRRDFRRPVLQSSSSFGTRLVNRFGNSSFGPATSTALGTTHLIRHAIRLSGWLLAVGLLLASATAPAAEDDTAALDKIVKLNKRAVDEYQNLNFDKARKLLDEALAACTRSGLDSHPVAARTHVHMGVVLFAGLKDKDGAVAEFKKAAQIQPDMKLDTALATPEIQEAYDQAVAGRQAQPPAAEGPPRRPPKTPSPTSRSRARCRASRSPSTRRWIRRSRPRRWCCRSAPTARTTSASAT